MSRFGFHWLLWLQQLANAVQEMHHLAASSCRQQQEQLEVRQPRRQAQRLQQQQRLAQQQHCQHAVPAAIGTSTGLLRQPGLHDPALQNKAAMQPIKGWAQAEAAAVVGAQGHDDDPHQVLSSLSCDDAGQSSDSSDDDQGAAGRCCRRVDKLFSICWRALVGSMQGQLLQLSALRW